MPEGHTIHRLAREHGRELAGHPVAVSSPQGRFSAGATRLDGRTLVRAEPYGKHLFYWWDGDEVLHVHLGLAGKFATWDSPAPAPVAGSTVRVRLEGARRTFDLTGPNTCELVTPDDRDAIVAALGPDPLRADADPARAWERMRRSRAPIGVVLLDQAAFAGVGNVFRAEALFALGLHPETPASSLSRDQCDALWDTVRTMMRRARRENRIVTVDREELGLRGRHIDPRDGRYVYRQEACRRCGSAVRRWDLRGRFAYACPRCQPA